MTSQPPPTNAASVSIMRCFLSLARNSLKKGFFFPLEGAFSPSEAPIVSPNFKLLAGWVQGNNNRRRVKLDVALNLFDELYKTLVRDRNTAFSLESAIGQADH